MKFLIQLYQKISRRLTSGPLVERRLTLVSDLHTAITVQQTSNFFNLFIYFYLFEKLRYHCEIEEGANLLILEIKILIYMCVRSTLSDSSSRSSITRQDDSVCRLGLQGKNMLGTLQAKNFTR